MSDLKDRELSLADFAGFFEEVHGYGPFPWQEALVARVLSQGWPGLIDVPTGLGKTAVLDVAVFLSALGSEHARRRVFLVVDRRIIVDQAFNEAGEIREALLNPPPGSVCARVRARLALPGDEADAPLGVTRMRGGVNWSWLWIERPDRYSIITGTVDQVGSRLLFRGYGVGGRLRPIDAAMVGTDSLIVVDEAHLSDPFCRTLTDALAMDGGNVGRKPMVVTMSASPETGDGEVHGMTDADVRHPVAAKRLWAAKSLHPVEVTATAAVARSAVADAIAYWARQLGGPGKVIGVVGNTVTMARDAFERLREQVSDPDACVLLTGRVRPIDREYLLDEWYPKIKSGARRDLDAEVYVVATQTIEAGADIDLDGLVTQAASLPALVQRLGRLNRMGERADAHAVVVHGGRLADPVYGAAASETWSWLTGLTTPLAHKAGRSVRDLGQGIGVSPNRLRDLVGSIPDSERGRMQGEKRYVPLISRATLDAWARTSPAPHPDAPVAPYLHGIDVGEPTVSVIWRADLLGDDPISWKAGIRRIPPSTDEAIELPISAARRWLRQLAVGGPAGARRPTQPLTGIDISDLESQQASETEDTGEPGWDGPRVLRYRGADDQDQTPGTARDLRPGDVVIVKTSWGGSDRYGWHPGSGRPVTDVADFTGWRGRRTAAIRIGPVLLNAVRSLAPDLGEQVKDFVARINSDIENESVKQDDYASALRTMIGEDRAHLPVERVLWRLADRGRLSVFDSEDRDGDAGSEIVGLYTAGTASWNEDETTAGSSASPKQVSLAKHQDAVGRRAREFATNLGLPDGLAEAIERAARYHDEGKRDLRFQAMLNGGDRLRAWAMADRPLAKSGMDPADRAAFRRASVLSGYPSRMRHEALSARIAAARLEHSPSEDLDRDLVVHLVAAHHGCSRPLLPPIADSHPEKVEVEVSGGRKELFDTSVTVDWASPGRFEKLCGTYGRWGLAWLESIVRLADMWCSARSEGCDDQA
jgi:CRISPR-associated endonuclease/helicase Cas3